MNRIWIAFGLDSDWIRIGLSLKRFNFDVDIFCCCYPSLKMLLGCCFVELLPPFSSAETF